MLFHLCSSQRLFISFFFDELSAGSRPQVPNSMRITMRMDAHLTTRKGDLQ